jgi:hypothetical protein
LTIFRLRNLISRAPKPHIPNLPDLPNLEDARPKNWSAKNWALVTLAGILAIAGLEGYALSLGIDGTALRAALTSIGVLGGAGFSRVLK